MLTKYGYTTIGIVILIIFIIGIIAIWSNNTIFRIALFSLGGILLAFTLNFFRDPDRIPDETEDVIISPADGKVLIVKDVDAENKIGSEGKQVSIFMSPFNVHVNRIPISGVVKSINYIKGEYLVAYHDKADERNERSEITIQSEHGPIFFTQVAGMVARRIIYELKEKDEVTIGKRFGMIKFGSRVDVIVPNNWEVNVKVGDNVSAGKTVLFKIKNES
ncbi:MAG: phosphatidylserine decarboxylase family protein [Melioribacteraceae bacterium]|nr:phosphatidylserine decarboxylase family protein [Melioribacteraceae bacterium]MCF8355442.1 phosphatidylserine decarboxylase family protein [Melioribacteraceae bacterium]MCF8395377.1 phosphatidylserine decarboxylase family protein [Melioribacteraceae bacterium]MCF8420470.1 phosphatidylserine decarboxylase family protein [Melioribacteraceae bacterium]